MNQSDPGARQRIAIVGSGIAGLTTAYLLYRHHDITVFEANDYVGGHTHTIDVESGGKTYPVNTGFIVFNDWTYPNFIRLMDQLNIASEASDMSFSVKCEKTGLEYNGTSLNSLFAQRGNIFRPSFWSMVRDILRFNKQTMAMVKEGELDDTLTLGEFLQQNNYGEAFKRNYIIPMGAAIWSCGEDAMTAFPLAFFLKFFANHGMLSVDERPQWRVLTGGSHVYVKKMLDLFGGSVRVNTPVSSVSRNEKGVVVETEQHGRESFDQVVFACHSDQALAMLAEPTAAEQQVLGAIPYQPNDVVLHTDSSMLPKRKLAWASWNYHIPTQPMDRVALTYDMNILQNYQDAADTFCVTLNRTDDIDPDKIIARYEYSHPTYTLEGMAARERFGEISGQNRTHFCGAYWFNGFHEDGVNSALRVGEAFGLSLDNTEAGRADPVEGKMEQSPVDEGWKKVS